MLPQASVYRAERLATRDLLRRRTHLMRKHAEFLAHIQDTNSQYNLPDIDKKIAYKANREGVAERFEGAAMQQTLEVDLALITMMMSGSRTSTSLSSKRPSHTMPTPSLGQPP
jgi:hypothetical protein